MPSTLVTGKAKVWSQRTSDGGYALVYNPSKRNRFPLIVVTGRDAINFGDMRVVQGELPVQRYAGMHRSIGPQYIRGISHWATDGSRTDDAVWLVYSINKEDIWVSRVPIPIRAEETGDIADDFATFKPGPFVPGWNIYRPKWSSVEVIDGALQLENHDPYDHAIATRVFHESRQTTISFELELAEHSYLEIDLLSKFGSRPSDPTQIGRRRRDLF